MTQAAPSHPDDTGHRLALYRLVRIARAVLAADGATEDLARMRRECAALHPAIIGAMEFAERSDRAAGVEAWSLLVQACRAALRHIEDGSGDAASRAAVASWKAIVGVIFPIVDADWQAWRDTVAPKLGRQAPSEPSAAREPDGTAFGLGDQVEKYAGEARYVGQVVSVYQTTKGGSRYVVEVQPQGFQMICTRAMLRALADGQGTRP
ncbi:hypothetical protein [Azorhizobium doebereinerae]|uniref:hypothetical protein n=1 Tax=Azorhizobium doebereinerae TaxID=281091 RepID=UPI0003FEB8FD|nr:hypothetical protein [Azorhizobium doebereinerae]